MTNDGSLLVVSSVNLSQTIDLQLFLTILHTYYFNRFSSFDLFQFLLILILIVKIGRLPPIWLFSLLFSRVV